MNKEKYLLYAKNALINTKFEDEELKKSLNKFLLNIVLEGNFSSSTLNADLSYYKNTLIKFFLPLSLSDINSEWFISTIRKIKSKDLQKFTKIIIYLLDNKIIKDSNLYRLLLLRKRFLVRAVEDEFVYVLNKKKLDNYVTKGFFKTKKSIQTFFIVPNYSNFKDPLMYKFISHYIEYTKINTSKTFSSLCNILHTILKISKNYFYNTMIKEFDINLVRKYIKTGNKKIMPPRCFADLLFFGLNNNYIHKSIYFKSVMPLSKDICNFITTKKFEKIFCSNSPSNYAFIKINDSKTLFFISTEAQLIRKILINFFTSYNTKHYIATKKFSSCFNESLGEIKVRKPEDFNFNTFKTQLDFFLKKDANCIYVLISFYLYIFREYKNKLFKSSKLFTVDVLQRHNIAKELIKGFKFVPYSSYETFPEFDKWIFYYPDQEGSNNSINKNSSSLIDFTTIRYAEYRKLAKFYIWHDNISMNSRIKNYKCFRYFLNFVYDIKNGNQLSYFSRKSNNYTINTNDIIAYKNNVLSNFQNHITSNHYIYVIRKILKFLDSNGLFKLEKAALYHLSNSPYHSPNNPCIISNYELKQLSKLMKYKAENNIVNKMHYAIFYILLETEFRISQVLTLEKDCVFETYKSNQYIIKSTTKRSPKNKQEQPITIYVKRQLDEVRKISEVYRNNCHRKKIKKYLFITPSLRNNMYGIITPEIFNEYLQKCCTELNIKKYTSSNLRDTHMTKSEEYVIRNSLSDIEMSTLTGHKSIDTTNKHYIHTEITDLLESVHGIVIGNINVDGNIVKDRPNSISEKDSVSNQCGYCSSNSCNNLTYLDCLLCKSFVTCIDRIPYFEEQLKIIDYKIQKAKLTHDLEDLRNIKKLLVAYLKKLLILKEEVSHA
jgi:integrase